MKYIYNKGFRDLDTFCSFYGMHRMDLDKYKGKDCVVLVKVDTQDVFVAVIYDKWVEDGFLPCELYDVVDTPKHFYSFFEPYMINDNHAIYCFKNNEYEKTVNDYAKEAVDLIDGVISNHCTE